ncbi:pyruvate dehydrogenase E2 component (dihydrolipoamide acetyltransferase) [Candidatus Hakubella thermalkaliphila]|uniref:Dihydrolipoamide acetyltransferase component of pyruvate dehydrogenase complex n=2 Tax=Candidatus Hakubella thermalkaliphila TaxID=2754717 RepID=A0A6V8PV72_9ACTN|nr:pyruvate dehydrogenase E2 component (dihydrolipoamide acetyltransferase) [Candidatus Hakubella thermalkaliphila]GFP41093.1 pyruvate dehydrogenase E2 component (dihydrolipoamide acetyltransferase) [Candidatus Hakubella thermalkaliphila]
MPEVAHTASEVKILRWHKKEGEPVEEGEVLLEVETDKATLEIESYAKGILRKLYYQEEELVSLGETIALIGEGEEPLPPELLSSARQEPQKPGPPLTRKMEEISGAFPQEELIRTELFSAPCKERPPEEKAPRKEVTPETTGPLASPRTRKLAQEMGLDLALIQGTGPGGLITEEDLKRALEDRERVIKEKASLAAEPGPEKEIKKAAPSPRPGRIMALSPMRKTIAQRMTQSFRDVPHLVLKTRAEASGLIKLREALNATLAEEHKITFSDILLKAIGLALFSFPQVNSLLEEDHIRELPQINVGLAIATGEGLVAPVVPQVDKKSLKEISQHSRALIQRARQGRLLSSDLKEAALTLSNLGMFGIEEFTAIINPPQAAILAVGRIAPEPIVQGEKIIPAPCLHLTLSADHRLIDGALAAQFLAEIKDILENPGRMLV